MSWPRPDTLPTAPVVWLGMTASIEATATMAATAIGRERSGQANGRRAERTMAEAEPTGALAWSANHARVPRANRTLRWLMRAVTVSR